MSPCVQYASFLIRLWRPAGRGKEFDNEWHSEVEHIQSGNSWMFGSMEELEEFIHQQAVDPQNLAWIEIQQNDL